MQRLRFYDLRVSRLPMLLGICRDDRDRLADYVNAAQQRLLNAPEAGDEGWWGTWAEMEFVIDPARPYITLPRGVARIMAVTVRGAPIRVRNQFYEYLQFGNGRLLDNLPRNQWFLPDSIDDLFTRNNVVTWSDLTGPSRIRVYLSSRLDIGKRVLVQGYDANGKPVYSLYGNQNVEGEYVNLAYPYGISATVFSHITGIQKDETFDEIEIRAVDSNDNETVLLRMQPSEQTALYRRYVLGPRLKSGLTRPMSVHAIVKLDHVPVKADSDYCVIQNQEALIAECQAVRYSEVGTRESMQLARERHLEAIRLLNGELQHYVGARDISVDWSPFGDARLETQGIGYII